MPRGESRGRIARGKGDALSVRCASIPGRMYAARSLSWAHTELAQMAKLATGTGGVLVERRQRRGARAKEGDVLANLWFVRAVHEYGSAAAAWGGGVHGEAREHLEYAGRELLPVCRRIVQEFISGGMDGVRMGDGGMLAASGPGKPTESLAAPLRLNALWYAALEMTGMALRGKSPVGEALAIKDAAGDHFERLAGRFRRAFSKMYWCDKHGRVCMPELRTEPEHGAPDAEQLLLASLPASPLPRTKQREVLEQFEKAATGVGLTVNHPEHGVVESPLHRAWLVQGIAAAAESGGERDEAAGLARGLMPLWEVARGEGVHAWYKDGKALEKSDVMVTSEVLGTLVRFLGSNGEAA